MISIIIPTSLLIMPLSPRLAGNRLSQLQRPTALDNLSNLEVTTFSLDDLDHDNHDHGDDDQNDHQVLNLARNSLPTLPLDTFASLPHLRALR